MVVFLVDGQRVSGSAHFRKGKEHMSTEKRIDIFRPEGSTFGSILEPVGIVTSTDIPLMPSAGNVAHTQGTEERVLIS